MSCANQTINNSFKLGVFPKSQDNQFGCSVISVLLGLIVKKWNLFLQPQYRQKGLGEAAAGTVQNVLMKDRASRLVN